MLEQGQVLPAAQASIAQRVSAQPQRPVRSARQNTVNRLSVVIPAYNEMDGIARVIERVQAMRSGLSRVGVADLELIVVDDGSCDATAEIVAKYPAVRLICHEANRGYGAAIKTGFRHATGNLLAFLDADGTYPPECLPELCREAIERGADLVIGSRMSGGDSRMPLVRRVGNGFFAGLLSLLTAERVADSASGMRVIRSEALPALYPLPDGLNFTPVMSTRALHENLTVAEVPIAYQERVGRSKLSVIHDGQRFLSSMLWTVLAYNPVRVLGLVGGAGIGLAALIGLALVATRLSGVTTLGPWGAFAVFAALVLAVVGVSIFSLGATFNYLVSLFHKRPLRRGLFGSPIFNPSLDHHFGCIGLLAMAAGALLAAVCMALGNDGWPVSRLWLYLLGSAMFLLVGVQLVVSWIIMRVLEELNQRETRAGEDLGHVSA
jgi:glycosyltransferase involved in cell wall biosynthesis